MRRRRYKLIFGHEFERLEHDAAFTPSAYASASLRDRPEREALEEAGQLRLQDTGLATISLEHESTSAEDDLE